MRPTCIIDLRAGRCPLTVGEIARASGIDRRTVTQQLERHAVKPFDVFTATAGCVAGETVPLYRPAVVGWVRAWANL